MKDSAVFSTWIGLKRRIEGLKGEKPVTVDLSETVLVDHTVMERLHEMQTEFEEDDSRLEIRGLDGHRALSEDPTAARRRKS